jgi:hypothetical protein
MKAQSTKVVSRKQWRYLRMILDDLEASGREMDKETGYAREHLQVLLDEVDYEPCPRR